jgi:hypothetical protein
MIFSGDSPMQMRVISRYEELSRRVFCRNLFCMAVYFPYSLICPWSTVVLGSVHSQPVNVCNYVRANLIKFFPERAQCFEVASHGG